MCAQLKSNPDIVIFNDTASFSALKEDWDKLYHDCALSHPLQSWAWLYSWWESFGEGYELHLITVWDRDLLVGIIPLMLERRWGFGRLLFIGERAQQKDLLVKEGWEDKVAEAGIQALRQINAWHLFDARDISPVAATWGIFQRWNGRQAHILTDYYHFLKVNPWNELLSSLSKKHRSTVRRTLRRAEEDDVRSTMLAKSERVEQAARRLVALHRSLRQGRNISREHLTPEFESFIVAAARRMTDSGLGGILEFWRGGEVIISSFTFFEEKITYAYLVGVSQEAMQRYQWSSLGIYGTLITAQSRNSAYVCLAQAADPYKQKWPHKEVPHYRIVLGRGSLLFSLYSMYLSLRAWAKKYIKADSTPNLIKNVAKRLGRG